MNISSLFLHQYPHLDFRTMTGGDYRDHRPEVVAVSSLANAVRPTVTLPYPLTAYHHGIASQVNQQTESKFEIPPSYTRNGRKRAIPFPLKLMRVLSDEEYSHIISWMPSGRSFVILRPKSFVTEVLPKNFKSAQYASFTRKLTRWGFIRSEEGTGEFHHPQFRKGRMDLVEKMALSHGTGGRAKQTRGEDLSALEGEREASCPSPSVESCLEETDEIASSQVSATPTSRKPVPATSPKPFVLNGADAGVCSSSTTSSILASATHARALQIEIDAMRLRQSIHAATYSQNHVFRMGRYAMLSSSVDMGKLMLTPQSFGLMASGHALGGLGGLLADPHEVSLAATRGYPFPLNLSPSVSGVGRNAHPSLRNRSANIQSAKTA
jgi:hypothetical protein